MANKLSLNVKKSNFVIFRPYQKRIDYEVNIKIFDYSANSLVSLERKKCVRSHGVLIDSKLPWTDHITYFHQNQQILRHSCEAKAFCPFSHFIKHVWISYTTLLVLWYSCLGSSCSNFDYYVVRIL